MKLSESRATMDIVPVSAPPRRWLRLSLRALMLVVAVLACGLGWLVRSANRQRDAVATIESAGGRVTYDGSPRGMRRAKPTTGLAGSRRARPQWPPRWLVARFGIDYFSHPVMVRFFAAIEGPQDAVLSRVGQLGRLGTFIIRAERLNDESLAHLAGLTSLNRLELYDSNIGDAGLAHLKNLRRLRYLILDKSRITDDGLAHLEGLTNLEYLSLEGSQVSDAGLAHLRGLTRLKQLDISNTQVTLDGPALREFHRALPTVRIIHSFGMYGTP